MTVTPEAVMSETAPSPRLSNQPITLTVAAHAALFIAGSIWMMGHDYISVAHRLYLAFLGSGLVAWVGLLAIASVVLAARTLGKLALRGAAKEDRRVVGRLATA
ncbi:MAG: hypothetical protein AAGF84_10760 [Planctomycetota bacterium]